MDADEQAVGIIPDQLQARFHILDLVKALRAQGYVFRARHDHLVAGDFIKFRQAPGDIQIEVLFRRSVPADRAAVLPAVARVDHYHRRFCSRSRRDDGDHFRRNPAEYEIDERKQQNRNEDFNPCLYANYHITITSKYYAGRLSAYAGRYMQRAGPPRRFMRRTGPGLRRARRAAAP